LLDGLDEVALEKRSACIEAINTYHQEQAFLPLVVTSRSADYLQQSDRLRLSSAVTIQSLTQQQVDEYLAQA
jgi:predicted NACHT family NTPase